MSDGRFGMPAWYAHVGANVKERNVLRHLLVRGLKDYFESAYGYDRYGAETIFQLEERMAEPYIYGFALQRILHDRRVSVTVKSKAARWALDHARYGAEGGVPFGFFGALIQLHQSDGVSPAEIRYALTLSSGEQQPFRGLDAGASLTFVRALIGLVDIPAEERLFWCHSLVARHRDEAGASALIDAFLGDPTFSAEIRIELCRAWLRFRQPRLAVKMPLASETDEERFVASHLPFWLAHVPAWPSFTMVRRAPVWLARLGEDALAIADEYLQYRGAFADQIHQAAADVLLENVGSVDREQLRVLIDCGLQAHVGVSARRGLYRAGMEAFGADYLDRAQLDSAGSVRVWARKQRTVLG